MNMRKCEIGNDNIEINKNEKTILWICENVKLENLKNRKMKKTIAHKKMKSEKVK